MLFMYKLKLVWEMFTSKAAAIGAGIIAAGTLIVGYKVRVKSAERKGRKEGAVAERNRVDTETKKAVEKMERKSHEVRKDADDLGERELADSLRKQQSRIRNR